MHIQTHVLSGWCIGNLVSLSARERLFCMLVACLPDLDGFGMLISQDLYWDYHHIVGHNLFYGLLLSGIFVCFSQHRVKALLVYLALFHSHLILDYYGSGPGWGIAYLWPLSAWNLENPSAWEFSAWQNVATGFAFVAWMLAIVLVQKRTVLELPMPALDRQLVELGQKLLKRVRKDAS